MTAGVLLTLLLLQTPAAPPRDVGVSSEQAAGTCVLRGRVLDALSGQSIKGATVTLHSPRQQAPAATITDADGRWEIGGLPEGEYHLSAGKSGYVTRSVDLGHGVDLTESRPERSVDLRIARGGVLSGRITDDDGEPLADAMVSALRETPTGRGRRWIVARGGIVTNDLGEFRVYGLDAGEYVLAAQPQERHTHSRLKGQRPTAVLTYYPGTAALAEAQRIVLDVGAEYSDLSFPLQSLPSISVRGRVVTSADRAVNGFGALIPLGDRTELGTTRTTSVGRDGSFNIIGVTAGVYRLGIRVELVNGEQEVGRLDVTAGEQDITGLVVSTHGPTMVTGRIVVEPTNARRPEVLSVGAQPVGDAMDFASHEEASVKPDGAFALKVYHAPMKLYQSAPADGWFQSGVRWKGHDVSGGLMFEPGQPVEGVEIVLRRATSRVTGSVSAAVSAAEGEHEGSVIAFRDGHNDRFGIGIAGMVPIRNGRFALGPLPAGDYQVAAIRSSDKALFAKPELLELVRTRATGVSVGDNETKTVNLTLITDY